MNTEDLYKLCDEVLKKSHEAKSSITIHEVINQSEIKKCKTVINTLIDYKLIKPNGVFDFKYEHKFILTDKGLKASEIGIKKYIKSLEKNKWKYATIIIGVLAVIIPAFQTMYYSNLSNQNEILQKRADSLSVELNLKQELNKESDSNSHSISTPIDSLNTSK